MREFDNHNEKIKELYIDLSLVFSENGIGSNNFSKLESLYQHTKPQSILLRSKDEINKLQVEVKELTRQRDLYKKSNDYYANIETWELDESSNEYICSIEVEDICEDKTGGKLARQTEEEVKNGGSDE